MKKTIVLSLAMGALLLGCGDDSGQGGPDAAPDRAYPDAGTSDRPSPDTSHVPDATLPDAGPGDALVQDGSAPDVASACQAAGGTCTDQMWEICPVGQEPATGDPLDCVGHCCVPAPDTTCTQNPATNCVAGRCTGCWAEDSHGQCEAGRSCCAWICN